MPIKPREPGLILVFSVISCGIYLIYWYYKIYEELELLNGSTPTGHSFILDFFLNIVTCGIYGIWVDYKISIVLKDMQVARNHPSPSDTGVLVVVLDIAAFFTGYMTNFISSAIQQDLLNKTMEADWQAQAQAGPPYQGYPPAGQPPAAPPPQAGGYPPPAK